MLVYRITRSLHQGLDGEGARRSGGRWNSPGIAVVYASETRALAALEYLVRIDVEEVPDDLVLLSIEVPDQLAIERVGAHDLRQGWDRVALLPECRTVGDTWEKSGRTPMLCVPSAPIPEESNYLLSPRHRDAGAVRVTHARSFAFDQRLLLW